jgi:hypothetical protein
VAPSGVGRRISAGESACEPHPHGELPNGRGRREIPTEGSHHTNDRVMTGFWEMASHTAGRLEIQPRAAHRDRPHTRNPDDCEARSSGIQHNAWGERAPKGKLQVLSNLVLARNSPSSLKTGWDGRTGFSTHRHSITMKPDHRTSPPQVPMGESHPLALKFLE